MLHSASRDHSCLDFLEDMSFECLSRGKVRGHYIHPFFQQVRAMRVSFLSPADGTGVEQVSQSVKYKIR